MKPFYMYFPETVIVFHPTVCLRGCSMLVRMRLPRSLFLLCACCVNVPQIHLLFSSLQKFSFFTFYFRNNIAAICILGLAGLKGIRSFHFDGDSQTAFQKVSTKLYYHLVQKYQFSHTLAKRLKFCPIWWMNIYIYMYVLYIYINIYIILL